MHDNNDNMLLDMLLLIKILNVTLNCNYDNNKCLRTAGSKANKMIHKQSFLYEQIARAYFYSQLFVLKSGRLCIKKEIDSGTKTFSNKKLINFFNVLLHFQMFSQYSHL